MSSESEFQSEDNHLRKRVSVVWTYFEKLNRFRVRCNICNHVQNYQGTTGNILRHLKNKHDIDLTVKARKEEPPSRRLEKLQAQLADMDEHEEKLGKDEEEEEYDVIIKAVKNEVNIVSLPRKRVQLEIQPKANSYRDDADIDPYEETTSINDYIIGDVAANETAHNTNIGPSEDGGGEAGKHVKDVNSIQEQRMLAEIEYFREKAAYYRMQKNLTALQAKKVKYELEQLI